MQATVEREIRGAKGHGLQGAAETIATGFGGDAIGLQRGRIECVKRKAIVAANAELELVVHVAAVAAEGGVEQHGARICSHE